MIISQRFSHRSESSEPHVSLPILRVWHQEEEALDHLALKASRTWVQELHRTEGKEIPLLEGTQKFSHALGPRAKLFSIGAWARNTCGSWRFSWWGGGVAGGGCGSLWGKTLVADALGNIHQCEPSQSLTFWHQDLAPENSLQVPAVRHLRPNNQQGEKPATSTRRKTAWSPPEWPDVSKHTLWHSPAHKSYPWWITWS